MKGLGKLERQLTKIAKNIQTKPVRAVRRESRLLVEDAKARIVAQDAVASTTLYRGMGMRVIPVPDGRRVIIENTAPHAGFVEFGTGSKRSPTATVVYKSPSYTPKLVQEIREWMVIKPSFTTPATWGRAHAIAKHISQVGTSPQPFMEPAWFYHELRIKRAARTAVKRSTHI